MYICHIHSAYPPQLFFFVLIFWCHCRNWSNNVLIFWCHCRNWSNKGIHIHPHSHPLRLFFVFGHPTRVARSIWGPPEWTCLLLPVSTLLGGVRKQRVPWAAPDAYFAVWVTSRSLRAPPTREIHPNVLVPCHLTLEVLASCEDLHCSIVLKPVTHSDEELGWRTVLLSSSSFFFLQP
jgi:hypothetical protein